METEEKEKTPTKKETILLTCATFSVARAAFSKLTKAFTKIYREQTGYEVRFRMSYGGSGIQARAVIDGLPADIVALGQPLDVLKIQQVKTQMTYILDIFWDFRQVSSKKVGPKGQKTMQFLENLL